MSLLRNTLVQTTLTACSRLLGFARDVAISAVMGAGPISDAFVAAQRFPNLFRRLFAEGAFSQAFVPLYAKASAEGDSTHADRLASEALSFILAVTVILTIIAEIAMPWIMAVLFTGYRNRPEIFNLAVLLTQITMPYLVCMTLAALFSGVLNAVGRFALAAAAPTLLNLCLLVTPLAALSRGNCQSRRAGSGVFRTTQNPLAVDECSCRGLCGRDGDFRRGRIAGGLALVRRKACGTAFAPDAAASHARREKDRRAGYSWRDRRRRNADQHYDQPNFVVLEVGASTYLYNADRLYQLPLGLVGVAVGLALLPRLARAVRADDSHTGKAAMDEAITLSMALTLPAAMALVIIPYLLVYGFFVRGNFTHENAQMTAAALRNYAWGVPAFVLAKVLAPAFFAREDMRRPMNYALVSVAVNAILGAILFFTFQAIGQPGFVGLAIATSTAAWINVFLLYRRLKQTGVWSVSPALRERLLRILAAVGVTGVVIGALAMQRDLLIRLIFDSKVSRGGVCPGGGAALYAMMALAFGAVSLSEVKSSLRREKGGESLPSSPDA